MMCPGLTSPGGSLPPKDLALKKGTVVAIFAEGKEAPVGMGTLDMDTEEIKKVKYVTNDPSFSPLSLLQSESPVG
jgi:PUA domain protein